MIFELPRNSFRSPYDSILGVSNPATYEELQRAFVAKTREVASALGNPSEVELLRESLQSVLDAFEVLSTPVLRRRWAGAPRLATPKELKADVVLVAQRWRCSEPEDVKNAVDELRSAAGEGSFDGVLRACVEELSRTGPAYLQSVIEDRNYPHLTRAGLQAVITEAWALGEGENTGAKMRARIAADNALLDLLPKFTLVPEQVLG